MHNWTGRNTVSAILFGSVGHSRKIPLGRSWKKGQKQSFRPQVLTDIGTLLKLELFIDGKDGVLFETITVTTVENGAGVDTKVRTSMFLVSSLFLSLTTRVYSLFRWTRFYEFGAQEKGGRL